MVDKQRPDGEEGTSLVELLVVILLLGIIGSVTTVGLVTSFRTQLVATRGAETLDELRLTVQRMRDDIRSADEVCASSDSQRLAIWTDRAEGVVGNVVGNDEDVEVVIFKVNESTGRLTREVRNSGSVTLISDVIVTPGGEVFDYDVEPTEQEAGLVCLDTATLVDPESTVDTARVDLDIDVQNADGENTVGTTTSMHLRNAGLADATSGGGAGTTNDSPTASLDRLAAQCEQHVECVLDGEGSDPESGPLTFEWDLDGDGVFGDAPDEEDAPHTFGTTGVQPVGLRVTDDHDQSTTATSTIEIVAEGENLNPIAAFNFKCDGRTCYFDAINESYVSASEPGTKVSSDSDDAPGDLTYEWIFEPQGATAFERKEPDATESFAQPFTSSPTLVTLRVIDTVGGSDESTVRILTSDKTLYVSSLKASGSTPDAQNGTFVATLTVEVETTFETARDDVQVTVDIFNANTSVGTCSTGTAASGKCEIDVTAPKDHIVTFSINTVTDTADFKYDPVQSIADEIKVEAGQTVLKDETNS